MNDADTALSRRAYLATAGTAVLGLAGCQGGEVSGPTATSEAPTNEPTPTSMETRAPTDTETDTPETDPAVAAAAESIAELDFDGKLFDTHVHWDRGTSKGHPSLTLDLLTSRQAEHDVGAAVLFSDLAHFVDDYGGVVETLARESVDYLPFMSPQTMQLFSGDGLESMYRGSERVFHGVGEMAYYGGPLRGQAFDDPPMAGILEFCARNDLAMMVHPTQMQVEGINQVLPQFPDTDFLFHGFQTVRRRRAGDTADRLLARHDNLYWTYDVIEMTNGLYTEASGKDDFIERFDRNRSRSLDRATSRLPQLLEVAPDRVMWGTDVATEWNMDPAVYRRGIELTWDVIDSLPAEHRDAYAYGNAVALFGD